MDHKEEHPPRPATAISVIPDGFAVGTGPDGQKYIVPQYMLPALQQSFDAYQGKFALGVAHARGGLLQVQNKPFDPIAGGDILFPPDPQPQDLSPQEALNLHAEIETLQEKLGISYKDASHRLYLAHVEKLRVADAAYKAFRNIDNRLEATLANLAARYNDAASAVTGTGVNPSGTSTGAPIITE